MPHALLSRSPTEGSQAVCGNRPPKWPRKASSFLCKDFLDSLPLPQPDAEFGASSSSPIIRLNLVWTLLDAQAVSEGFKEKPEHQSFASGAWNPGLVKDREHSRACKGQSKSAV